MRKSLVLLLAVFCAKVFAQDSLLITSSIEIPNPSEPLRISFRINNFSNETLIVSKWNTPFEATDGVNANCFKIESLIDKTPSQYMGKVIKRDEIGMFADGLILSAYSSQSGHVDASLDYAFPFDGKYSIQLSVNAAFKKEDGMVFYKTLTSNAHIIYGSPSMPHRTFGASDIDEYPVNAVPMNGCTNSQASDVNSAISIAKTSSKTALTYMQTCPTKIYSTTWFGQYVSTRANTVTSNFQKINNFMNGGNFKINCGGDSCSPFTYAYVFPADKTHNVYLCDQFWKASKINCKYNSQPGTLVHESAHFNDVAGTQDYQYGTDACKSLAKSNPSQAIANSDNYEYFSEDCPKC